MELTTFWNIIEHSLRNCGDDLDEQLALIFEALSELPGEEIIAFEKIFHGFQNSAYRADLWDAADLIRCHCTEDHFWTFRPWLVTRGQAVFEKALTDPDSLVDVFELDFRDNPTFGFF